MKEQNETQQVNDSTTPLHLLQAQYSNGYGIPTEAEVRAKLEAVLNFIDKVTPCEVEHAATHETVTKLDKVSAADQIRRGAFRLTSYEWGVTYYALQQVARVTGEHKYSAYVKARLEFLAEIQQAFAKFKTESALDPQIEQVVASRTLDDCGAILRSAAAFNLEAKDAKLDELIANYFKCLDNWQVFLKDGTLARTRPFKDTLWLDDMFMAIPAYAAMAHYLKERKDELLGKAKQQFRLFNKHMFVQDKGLYRHGYVDSMSVHPAFFWARANGWALLTACELLDALDQDDPDYAYVLQQFKTHAFALSQAQDKSGFFNQLLDDRTTFLEGSATAIYVYCFAHGIAKGYLEASVFGPVALLGWQAVSSCITEAGHVLNTCVGTGMGFDRAFYACRPVHEFAAHGYGPALLAGSAVLELLSCSHPKLNDSAVHFYSHAVETQEPIFFE
ncbi:MAG: glycoside hydrolase family 88 protein [Succinivibrio sp.]|nr:glycoside hydrolase family 88 protein [Succinivibrio sp.]